VLTFADLPSRPLLDVTPRLAIVSRLYCELFQDSITEEIYDAKLAGLKYSLEHGAKSISVHVRGYNDKLPMFLKKMLKMMKDFTVRGERFAIIKEQVSLQCWYVCMYLRLNFVQLERECRNFDLREPYLLTGYHSSYARSERAWTRSEELTELLRKCSFASCRHTWLTSDIFLRHYYRRRAAVCPRSLCQDVHRNTGSR
jgi:insulysin